MGGADVSSIQAAAEQLTATLLAAYAKPGVSTFAWLPQAVPVDDDFVQSGTANPLLVSQWVNEWFQAIVVVDTPTLTVVGTCDHDTVDVVTEALVAATPLDPTSTIVSTLRAEAAADFGPLPPVGDMWVGTSPSDWMCDGVPYWTIYDSTTTTPPSTGGPLVPPPPVNPVLWQLRSQLLRRPLEPKLPIELPHVPPGPHMMVEPMMATERPATATLAAAPVTAVAAHVGVGPTVATVAILDSPADRVEALPINGGVPASSVVVGGATSVLHAGIAIRPVSAALRAHLQLSAFAASQPAVPNPDIAGSSLDIHLEHQLVHLDRSMEGIGWWPNGLFASSDWFIDGMTAGELTAATLGGSPDPSGITGLPIGLVVVRNVAVSAQWSAAAVAAVGTAPVTIGPLALPVGTGPVEAGSGTSTYSQPGMQVIAVLCQALEQIPPADAPAGSTSAASTSGG